MIKAIKHHIMSKSRGRKYQQFLQLTKPDMKATILDVGAGDKEYSPYDNYLEKKYPFPHMITALSILPLNEFSKRYPAVKRVSFTAGKFPFEDKQFSIVYSNAVIEHVGKEAEQLLFIKEMKRVGHQFFFATPAKECPIETHTNFPFLHWFPQKTFDRFLEILGKSWASGDYMNLLRQRDIVRLINAAEVREFKILTNRLFLFPVQYVVWGRG